MRNKDDFMKTILLLLAISFVGFGCSSESIDAVDIEDNSNLFSTAWRLVEVLDSTGESLPVPTAVILNDSNDLLGMLLEFMNDARFVQSYICQGFTVGFSLDESLMRIEEFGELPPAACAIPESQETQAQDLRLAGVFREMFAVRGSVFVDVNEDQLLLRDIDNRLLAYVPFDTSIIDTSIIR